MIFHHFAVEMSRIVVQNIQYFGATSNIRVENSISGSDGGREHMRLPGSKKPREGTRCVPARGLLLRRKLHAPQVASQTSKQIFNTHIGSYSKILYILHNDH